MNNGMGNPPHPAVPEQPKLQVQMEGQAQAPQAGNWQNWAGSEKEMNVHHTWNQEQNAAAVMDASKQMASQGGMNLWNFRVPEGNNVNNNSIWQNLYNNGMGSSQGVPDNTQNIQSAWAAQQPQNVGKVGNPPMGSMAPVGSEAQQPQVAGNWRQSQENKQVMMTQQQSTWGAAPTPAPAPAVVGVGGVGGGGVGGQPPVAPAVSNNAVVAQNTSPSPSTYAGAAASGLQSSQQSSSVSAGGNVNVVPLHLQHPQHSQQAQPQAPLAQPQQPLAQSQQAQAQMPPMVEWKEYTVPETGEKYYHNMRTGKTQWERPAELGLKW